MKARALYEIWKCLWRPENVLINTQMDAREIRELRGVLSGWRLSQEMRVLNSILSRLSILLHWLTYHGLFCLPWLNSPYLEGGRALLKNIKAKNYWTSFTFVMSEQLRVVEQRKKIFEPSERTTNDVSSWVSPFLSFPFPLSLCLVCVVIRAKEPKLTPETAASTLIEERVHELGKMFGFLVDIWLEVLDEDEWVTDKMATRVIIHEVPWIWGSGFPMANLLRWYYLCLT